MKKTRMILALLMALLVLWAVFPAMAEEGAGSMDVTPGGDEPPVVDDPTPPPVDDPTPPPVDDPTPPPADDPTPPPSGEDPTPPPDDEPTAEPSVDPTAEPSAEPTNEPTPAPVSDPNSGNQGSSPATKPSVNIGGSIRQPNISSRTPSSSSAGSSGTSGSSSSQVQDDSGPQYVTFARVTQKSNAMSRMLFYGGATCVGVGVLGLFVLAIFIIRGRRVDKQEEIFAEIEQAERQTVPQRAYQPQPIPQPRYEDDPYAQYDHSSQGNAQGYGSQNYQQQYDPRYAQGYESAAPSLHRPEPEDLAVPVNGSIYTEEFEIPSQQASYPANQPIMPAEASMYTEEFEPPRPVAPAPVRGAIRPTQASMYTEEFSLSEEMSQPPAPRRPVQPAPAPVQRAVRPQQVSRPRPASQVPLDQMDTTELLREILHGDDN